MKKTFAIIFLSLLFVIILNGFVEDNPYFIVTKQDVELKIPAKFPKPFYDFKSNKLSPEIFTLGRKLFYDPLLSSDNTISCAFCHQRLAAFAHIDHSLSHGVNGKIGKRNVPPLQNLIFQNSFMWDGGVNNLEVQPVNPITNPVEMNETMINVVSKIKTNSAYVSLFNKAYSDTIINSERILKALAQFTGLMISSKSRYDGYLAKKDTFSETELNGYKLFKRKCENCHKEPLFTDNSFRNNGIAIDTSLKDNGRETITGKGEDKNKFRVPSLRNIERTYPYMHDGRFRNLEQVINHYTFAKTYDKGVDSSIFRIGNFSQIEKNEIISFLKTLTDKEFIYDKRFFDPDMHQ